MDAVGIFVYFLISCLMVAIPQGALLSILGKLGFVQHIREEVKFLHKDKKNTPTAGGLIFVLPLVIFGIIAALLPDICWVKTPSIVIFCLCIILASGSIGFWDDYLKKIKKVNEGLIPRYKLLSQLIISIVIALVLQTNSTNIFGWNVELPFVVYCLFVFCVVAGCLNAVNFTDGIDGLACSVCGWSYIGLGSIIWLRSASITHSNELVILSLILAGICFGFWFHNGKPAKVFMGDTGSFLLGGGFAIISLIAGLEWLLFIILLIPVFEIFSVIIQVASCKLSKKILKKDIRPFKMTPFHHHLEISGWSEEKIVFSLSTIQALIIIACTLLHIR